MQSTPQTLDYSPPPPPWHRRRLQRVLLGALFLLLVGSVWRWSSAVYDRAVVLYWQHKCMTFSQPADRVVYDEGPDAGELLKSSGYKRYSTIPPPMGNRFNVMRIKNPSWTLRDPPVVRMADCWRHFSDDVPCWPWADGATLFSHEMISKTGVHRLVIIQRTPGIEDGFFRLGMDLDPAVFVPGEMTTAPRGLPSSFNWNGDIRNSHSPQNLRIYAGQLDPADPSHFTIRYEQWGQSDILDGWLDDNGGGIHVAPRNRPLPPRKMPP